MVLITPASIGGVVGVEDLETLSKVVLNSLVAPELVQATLKSGNRWGRYNFLREAVPNANYSKTEVSLIMPEKKSEKKYGPVDIFTV